VKSGRNAQLATVSFTMEHLLERLQHFSAAMLPDFTTVSVQIIADLIKNVGFYCKL
jgi:hypothetical protein